MIGVGVTLALEAFEPAHAGVIAIGNDPGLALRAVAVLPSSFAD
jgi:hypothetical protein